MRVLQTICCLFIPQKKELKKNVKDFLSGAEAQEILTSMKTMKFNHKQTLYVQSFVLQSLISKP